MAIWLDNILGGDLASLATRPPQDRLLDQYLCTYSVYIMYVTICIHIYILLIVMIVKLKKVDKLLSFPLVVFSRIDTVSMGSPAVGVIPSESYNSPSLTLKMT